MPTVVGVAFKPVTKIYYFDPAGIENLTAGDNVVVETSRGRTLGQVAAPPHEVPDSDITSALKPVVRRATAWDMVQSDQMSHREPEALQIAKQRAAALGMNIKVSQVEFSFDGSSAVVYFTSEQRVDFRNLVHELSQALHTRVEMRQVGVRDEAKFIGGYGKCGRELCCASWLREFTPVSIKMAKTQDLPLNAPEVSGVCGRLLCCLAYENDFYAEARKQMPRINSMVETPQGIGKVRQVHVLANSITVLVEGPNEVRLMVDMPVAEPEFSLAAKTRPAEPATAGEDELDAGQAGEQVAGLRDEAAFPAAEVGAVFTPDREADALEPREARPGAARRARARRKKRP
jgi:cell fate regulator YaaT (PSP1 superfamily)